MEPTLSSETSAFKLQTPGKFPKEHRLQSFVGPTNISGTIHSLVRQCLTIVQYITPNYSSNIHDSVPSMKYRLFPRR